LSAHETDAQKILNGLRDASGELGVTRQASYFKTEADGHGTGARNWLIATLASAFFLILYAIIALKMSLIYKPETNYEALQVGISKVLIFSVLAYILFICSRTLMAHRHNIVVNRHRENALMTFTTLVQASGSEDKRDIILTHAAACIFAPQDTGYTKTGGSSPTPSANIIEILPKLTHST
jgi:hypothetical protein